MPEPLFALLQTRHERIDPELLRDVLMQDAGMPRVDAVRASQKARGILTDRLTHKQAELCRASLAQRGVATAVLAAEKLAGWSRPVSVHWLGADDDGLAVPTDYYGGGGKIPWSSVFVVSAGLVMTTTEERVAEEVWDGNRYQAATVTQWKTKRKEELQHVAEIVGLTAEGQMMHFRLHAQRLHPQHVPQGGPAASRFQKYLLLLDDIVSRAAQAEISPETRQILADRRDKPRDVEGKKPYVFDERSFDFYNRWLLQLVLLREEGLVK